MLQLKDFILKMSSKLSYKGNCILRCSSRFYRGILFLSVNLPQIMSLVFKPFITIFSFWKKIKYIFGSNYAKLKFIFSLCLLANLRTLVFPESFHKYKVNSCRLLLFFFLLCIIYKAIVTKTVIDGS